MLWFFFLLLPSTFVYRSAALCGLPGYLTSLKYANYFRSLSSMFVFKNGQEVEYVCKNGLFMIGNNTRVCLGRSWSGSFPNCAIQTHPKFVLQKSIKGDQQVVNVAFHNITSISAVRLSNLSYISANEKSLTSLKIDNRFTCTLFTCRLIKDVFIKVKQLTITVPSTQPISLDQVELYLIQDHVCDKPDVPAFANLITKHSGDFNSSLKRYMIDCVPEYTHHLDEHLSKRWFTCDEINKSKDKIFCEPKVVCQKLPSSQEYEIHYTSVWNETHVLPLTIGYHFCKENKSLMKGNVSRTCLRSGQWSKQHFKCEEAYLNSPEKDSQANELSYSLASILLTPYSIILLLVIIILIMSNIAALFTLFKVRMERTFSLRRRRRISQEQSYHREPKIDDHISSGLNANPCRGSKVFTEISLNDINE